jgi:N-acetylglucosamine kinase-like BadF-type ATPase
VSRPAVLAVDGGGSKIDVVLVSRDGGVVGGARVRPPDGNGRDPSHSGPVREAVEAALRDAGIDPERRPLATVGVFCLAGADLPADDRRIQRWLRERAWTTETLLRNDTFAVLRAGTDRTWGVGVVCGFGTNCSAVAPDGRTFRLPALGWIAGDWGGGSDIGEAALWHAMRSEDGRGERTLLAGSVPGHFGLRRPRQLMEAMYFGRISTGRVAELPPLVFAAAAEGDPVARSIVERQADEIVSMAGTAIRRLRMARLDVHVVLGGGIFRNGFAPFFERIEDGLCRIAPAASVRILEAPPVAGAALLGLDHLGASQPAGARLRSALTDRPPGQTLERKG